MKLREIFKPMAEMANLPVLGATLMASGMALMTPCQKALSLLNEPVAQGDMNAVLDMVRQETIMLGGAAMFVGGMQLLCKAAADSRLVQAWHKAHIEAIFDETPFVLYRKDQLNHAYSPVNPLSLRVLKSAVRKFEW